MFCTVKTIIIEDKEEKRFVNKNFKDFFFKKYAVEIPQYHYIRYENIQEINELLEFSFL